MKVRFVPGHVTFEHARGLLFEGNRFSRLAADAIDVTGSVGNVFRGNVFEESAAGALKLDGLDDGSDSGNLLENNWVHGIGRDYRASIAVYLEDIVDSTLRHNQINDVPYSGISHTISETKGHGIQILQNRIFDAAGVMMDGGAIYTSGAQGSSYEDGGRIEGNVVHHVRTPTWSAPTPRARPAHRTPSTPTWGRTSSRSATTSSTTAISRGAECLPATCASSATTGTTTSSCSMAPPPILRSGATLCSRATIHAASAKASQAAPASSTRQGSKLPGGIGWSPRP